jgi:lipid II:glycine glycyltransferase (peptidoglycan interpeptide bridge formation enzyme)
LLIRDIPSDLGAPQGWCDATTPYGYPSPLIAPTNSNAALRQFLETFRHASAERKLVSAFFRLHPLLPLDHEILAENGELREHGETVCIDLSLSDEELWSQTRRDHKAGIKKLLKAGFHATMDDWNLFDEFIAIYTATMRQVSASDFYFFSENYFKHLRLALGEKLHLCIVSAPTGDVAAAGLFTVSDSIVQFHLSGTAPEYRRQGPSKLMLHHVRDWAKKAGARYFHLGGGVGGRDDSLLEFKSGFSRLRFKFYTFRRVLDQQKYYQLNKLWKTKHKDQVNGADTFFPIYRKIPLPPTG